MKVYRFILYLPVLYLRRYRAVLFLSVLAFSALSSCVPDISRPLRLAVNVWPGFDPLFLARRQGYFNDANVKLVEFYSTSQSIQALRNGAVDAAAVTLDEVIYLYQENVPISVFLVTDISNGADAILGWLDVLNIRDLRGRRVGVESASEGAYILARALEKAALQVEDINIINLHANELEEAFIRGKLDAVVCYEPIKTRLRELGAQVLFTTQDIPDESIGVLAVRNDRLPHMRKQINILTQAWFKSLAHLRGAPEEALAHLSRRLNVKPAQLAEIYDGIIFPDMDDNQLWLSGEKPRLLDSIAELQEAMLRNHLLKEKINLSQVIYHGGMENL